MQGRSSSDLIIYLLELAKNARAFKEYMNEQILFLIIWTLETCEKSIDANVWWEFDEATVKLPLV